MRVAAVLALSGLAAACGTSVDLNAPRVISVQADAKPAGVALSPSIAGLMERTSPSYVTLIVHRKQGRGRQGRDRLSDSVTSGSGFVIDGQGHVLTAGHVAVSKGFTVDARDAQGRLYRGKVIKVRNDNDMAIIKLSDFSGPPVTPAAGPCMRKGDPLFSLGKPHARGDTARIGALESMSFGRAVRYDNFGYPDALVLRMSTKKGESGGPLFDTRGELRGMVVSTLSDGNGRPLNLAHAIPLPRLGQFICQTTGCSPRWRKLSRASVSRCPKT